MIIRYVLAFFILEKSVGHGCVKRIYLTKGWLMKYMIKLNNQYVISIRSGQLIFYVYRQYCIFLKARIAVDNIRVIKLAKIIALSDL
jgi:hypothetical protein